MIPDNADYDDADRLQQRKCDGAPGGAQALQPGFSGERQVDRAKRDHAPESGADINVEVADEPRQRNRQENRKDRDEPDVVQQLQMQIFSIRAVF